MKHRVVLTLLLVLGSTGVFAQDDAALPVFAPPECAYTPDQPTGAACLERMAASPKPAFDRIPQDRQTLGTYSFWRIGPHAVTTYSGPGGSPVGSIPEGFNFVTAIDLSVEGWLQIEGGAWVKRDDGYYVEPSYFSGVLLPEDWNQPFAWVLDTTRIYASTYPGGPWTEESGYLTKRYDMVNIFAEAYDAEGWRWYMIGPNQWLKQTFVSKVLPVARPEGVSGRWVAIDLYEQTLVAYEDDRPVFATLVSSGLDNWDTNEGLFTIWARMPSDPMSGATGAPDAYALQRVPWVMYFDDSISLHGTYWHDLFGYRRSHGCVNLSISDARHLFEWTGAAAPEGEDAVNYVYVYSSGEYGVPPGLAAASS
ncbi:MAG: L,D-transpeptidase [Chloroflexi bacterium]|nr:L,D-transpeptidase [Chloroflexota bacterium]